MIRYGVSFALKFLIKNIDKGWWGWYDPYAVYLLDFWKKLDSKISFVLVDNSPEKYIANYIKCNKLKKLQIVYLIDILS